MQPIKRVEIVTEFLEMPEIIEKVEQLGISGYTLIKDVIGKGGRGFQQADELTDVFKNSLLLVACSEDQATTLVNLIRPLLKKRGGICIVSDAMWMMH